MNDGVIAQDVNVFGGEVRIPVEVWKDDKMLFPEYDESVPGRNLLLKSGIPVMNTTYIIQTYDVTIRDLNNNEPIAVSLDGTLGEGRTSFSVYNSGTSRLGDLQLKNNGLYAASLAWKRKDTDLNTRLFTYAMPSGLTGITSSIDWIMLVRGDVIPEVWTPAPEELLELATIRPVNCSYRIENNEIVLSNFTENRGYVDIEVSYGEGWTRTKRVNFQRKNRIQDIQVKGKRPFRAYLGNNLIWHKYHERTQAIFDYANDRYFQLPTNRIAYDDYMRGLIKNGLLDKLDLHYIFSGDGDTNFKLINVVNPGTYNGTAYGGLEWSAEGVKGNGVNGYMQTGLDLSRTDIHKYQLLDAGRGAFLRPTETHYTTSVVDMGKLGSQDVRRNSMYQVQTNNRKINSNSVASFTYPTLQNRAFITHNRNEQERGYGLFLRGNSVYANMIADDWVTDDFVFLLRYGENNNGYASDFTLMAYHIGRAITEQERDIWVQLYNNLLTSNNLATL